MILVHKGGSPSACTKVSALMVVDAVTLTPLNIIF